MKENGVGSQKIIRRKRDGKLEYLPDDLTIEEPLEIRVGHRVLATTMRTPGHDEELAAGFLVSEAVVRRREEIAKISTDRENTVVVNLAAGLKLKLNSIQRFGTISSSCGLGNGTPVATPAFAASSEELMAGFCASVTVAPVTTREMLSAPIRMPPTILRPTIGRHI